MIALRAFLRSRRGALLLAGICLAEIVTAIGVLTTRGGGSPAAASGTPVIGGPGQVDALAAQGGGETSTTGGAAGGPAASGKRTPGLKATGGAAGGSQHHGPPPPPPANVRATPGAGSARVSWDPSAGSTQLYVIKAYAGGNSYSGTLFACGTCTNVTFRSLTNGASYVFAVAARNDGGDSPAVRSGAVRPASDLCPDGPCIAVEGGAGQGAASLRAQGVLHGVTADTDKSRISALKLRSWRGSGGKDNYNNAGRYASSTTQILSDYWFKLIGPVPPWEDWTKYKSFVTQLVLTAKREGWSPTYWDVQDEPDYGLPYRKGSTVTQQNVLDVYKAAYEAIKTIDPTAKVIGPTLMGFQPDPDPKNPGALDLTTFLRYAAANNLKFDGIVWHETGAGHLNPYEWTTESVVNHVDALRGMLTQWPSLGHPAILLNEYVQLRDLNVPGWVTGYISAMERGNVDEANVTCGLGNEVANCYAGTLGGMLSTDHTTPRAAWWVHRLYAEMTGTRVDVTSSVFGLSGFATSSSSGMRILLGRHQSCTAAANWRCDEPASATPPATPLTIAVRVGGGDRMARVSVQRIPNTTDDVPALPPAGEQAVPIQGGVARVQVPQFADGEAYFVTVS